MIYPNQGDYPGADARTVPLMAFWIVAPLVLLILLVSVTRLFVPSIDRHVGGRLEGAAIRGGGDAVLIATFTEFEWDRACLFRPFTPAAAVRKQIGFGWNGLLDHDRPTLVFIHGQEVPVYTAISPRAVNRPPVGGACFGRGEASVRWAPAP